MFLSHISIASFLLLGSLTAFGGEGGVETHGGDGVVCTNRPIQILDFYEASLPDLSGAKPVLPIDNMTFKEVLDAISQRLHSTRLWNKFEASFKAVGNVNAWKVVDLNDVKDTEQLYPLPPNCRLKQAAARRGHVVFIDREVANSISQGQLAVLAIHETIFAMYDSFGASRTRAIVASLLMKEFSKEQLASHLIWVDDYLFAYEKFLNGTYQMLHSKDWNFGWYMRFERLQKHNTIKAVLRSEKYPASSVAIQLLCDESGHSCASQNVDYTNADKLKIEIKEAVFEIHPLSEKATFTILKGKISGRNESKRKFQLNRADL